VKKDDAALIRREYERAMSSCGREWRSDKLWDHYVKWEGEGKNYPEVFQLYQRMLKIPTHGLARNYEAFIALMNEHNPKVEFNIQATFNIMPSFAGVDGHS
jgi:pre-mRNA-processing factor 39